MKESVRRDLRNMLEDHRPAGHRALRRSKHENIADPEKALVDLVTALALKTTDYRRELVQLMDQADGLHGKLPGFEDSLEHMTGALEMSDKMLEDLMDATISDVAPFFKKLRLPVPRHT